ncbi:hypothetical protein IEO70_15815 [Bacillus sp. AGMB 02131]|uniref:DUF6385 domain-containing protein n=1 Tax=Peribacillus faecalis TaxID=2772559 RepID=A0A927HCN3_9BACI|nr:DUF6385 domain-containing protein [Peribacillus faecalis]MBD3109807.1 hypothetical protein [Peribacillus faecalis]
MRNRFRHRPQKKEEEEAYYQEVLEGEEIPNQWSLRLRKLESFHFPQSNEPSVIPIDIKRALIITKDRSASITFDISTFRKYTICIINESQHTITFSFELSPNNVHFMKKDYCEVKSGEMECVMADDYLKYARISVKGYASTTVIVYLQGYQ